MSFFHHNSRLSSCRTPFGAVPAGSAVRISADCSLPEGSRVYLRLWREVGTETLAEMTVSNGTASAEIPMPDAPCLVWYFFIIDIPEQERIYYGGSTGEGRAYTVEPPAYQITVFDGGFSIPESWRKAVCYQLFPDRFCRSSWEDFRNRCLAHTQAGREIRIHDRWTEEPDSTPETGSNEYTPNDFFGGDLNGIRGKLPYLASLGITAVYLNPIFESCSNHRYNTSDYHRIDPILGSREDFSLLVSEAREYGIRLILDGVFSHTGDDSRYFNRYGRYPEKGACQGKDSPYYEWYDFSSFPDRYACWWGFKSLPNVKELTPSYLDFVLGNNGVIDSWMQYPLGGWRLDVADELPDEFIRRLRHMIKHKDPEAALIGEVWDDCSNKYGPEGRRDYVDGDLLDGAMNYPLKNALTDFLTGKEDASAFSEKLFLLWEHYPEPFLAGCMNLLSSHDDIRLLYKLAECPGRTELTRKQQQEYRPSEEKLALSKKRIPAAFAFIVCFPGVPSLYYGDEAGMPGMMDPFNRGPFPWGHEDSKLLESARLLFSLRKSRPELYKGAMRMGSVGKNAFALMRFLPDGNASLLAINAGTEETDLSLTPDSLPGGPSDNIPLPLEGSWREVRESGSVSLVSGPVSLPPLSYKLYLKEV